MLRRGWIALSQLADERAAKLESQQQDGADYGGSF
jgi:hypothetical protein